MCPCSRMADGRCPAGDVGSTQSWPAVVGDPPAPSMRFIHPGQMVAVECLDRRGSERPPARRRAPNQAAAKRSVRGRWRWRKAGVAALVSIARAWSRGLPFQPAVVVLVVMGNRRVRRRVRQRPHRGVGHARGNELERVGEDVQ